MPPKHILIFRFSSLGDIAMTVPVIKLLLQQHPQLQVTFVSVAFVKPLFAEMERLHFIAADIRGKHNGIKGLRLLYKELNEEVSFDAIADLHNVLRTKILRLFFTPKRMAVIDKGRKEKRLLTRQHNKILKPLPSIFERYADVFAKLYLPIVLDVDQGIIKTNRTDAQWKDLKQNGYKIIGIAPFAQYEEKTYPIDKMRAVIQLLLRDKTNIIFLFGGKNDAPILEQMADENNSVVFSLAGNIKFEDELRFISQLSVMLSMDSANMHLASLYGVPVVSVWGGTHPFLGFLGWGQSINNCVQIQLACRPSSVFGNKSCPNHLACMNGIAPLLIVDKIREVLQS